MSPEDRVRAGAVVLVFDAPNVSTKKLFALAKAAKEHGRELRVVVPVTAHTEKLAQIRRGRGASYDAEQVRKALEDAGVEVLPLDVEAADSVAECLWKWFPTRGEWQDAKWKRLHGDAPRSEGSRASATIDWFTAALCPEGAIVVTDDAGAEFQNCETIGSIVLEGVLRAL